MKKIMVIVAHADDEVLGCGATIRKHCQAGDLVHIVICAGKGSSKGMRTEAQLAKSELAGRILGVEIHTILGLEDQKFDVYPLLEVVQRLEPVIEAYAPEIIYTHHAGDLNKDHRVVHQAVLTACRPLPGSSVKEIYGMEIASSTEWGEPFIPTHFVSISPSQYAGKNQALSCYEAEMRPEPHARSIPRVMGQLGWRGGSVGCDWAEAFTTIRTIVS